MQTAEKDMIFETWFAEHEFSSERDRDLAKRAYHTLMRNVYTEEHEIFTGKGLYCNHFSRSSVFILKF